MNGHFYFEIQAEDTKRAAQFDKAVFGWRFIEHESFPAEYWRIETGGARGGLLKRPAKTPPPEHGTNAFVLSHEPRQRVERDGVSFIFVTDGIESALEQAKTAAGAKDVCIAGGANTAQQYLQAGLVDEVQIHLVPVLFGAGLRLFEGLEGKLERIRVLESPQVTHLRFRVVKEKECGKRCLGHDPFTGRLCQRPQW